MTVIATAVWTAFLVWYTVRARWWVRAFGWNTALTSLALVLVVCYPGNPWVLAFVAAAGVWRIIILERAQREGNHK